MEEKARIQLIDQDADTRKNTHFLGLKKSLIFF